MYRVHLNRNLINPSSKEETDMFAFHYWWHRLYQEVVELDPMKQLVNKCLDKIQGPINELVRGEKSSDELYEILNRNED